VIPSIILLGVFSIPISAFVIWIAYDSPKIEYLFITPVTVLVLFAFPIRHLRNLYNFPSIELDNNFMVVNQPFQNRSVYTLSNVGYVKPFLKSVLFLHNGFPAIINMNNIVENDRVYIVMLLKSANNKIQPTQKARG